MNNRLSFCAFLLITVIFYGCSSNPLDVKLTDKEVSINYVNVDKQLYNQEIGKIAPIVKELESSLGDLFIYEMSQNVRENLNDSSYKAVYDFYNSEYISKIEKEKQGFINEIPTIEMEINQAFSYLRYHFGDSILPKNIFYMNKLFSQVSCSEQNIAVGLENYLSPNNQVIEDIPNSEIYEWQRKRMDISFLKRDVLLNWIQVQLFNQLDGKLAEHIIQAGKILYVLNASFPKANESYILRYNEKQYSWAINNEKSIWNYLVKEQSLFKTDIRVRTNFLNEGPTTVGLSPDSPDRIGQFLGYRIVKGYMTKNKALSLPELLDIKYNTILQTYEIQ